MKDTKGNPNKCPYCGTRTGIHGFSFGKDGKYDKIEKRSR